MMDEVRRSLSSRRDPKIVDRLLKAYSEAKTNFYQGGKRLSEVEGGRFCEAAFRLLEEETTGTYTKLGKPLDAEACTRQLANIPKSSAPDAIRLHIPRALRVVYDIRNNRDAAHLADGIDPNLQDATLVVGILDWILAELLRLWHDVSADQAQKIVEDLVKRRAPVIQEFDGDLKVLRAVSPGEHVLLCLYQRGKPGASKDELRRWAKPTMRKNLQRTFDRLEHDFNYIHATKDRYVITDLGRSYVDQERLLVVGV